MTSDEELATNSSTQLERLSAQLLEHQRDLQKRGNPDGSPLVQSAREAAERLLRDLRTIHQD
jgi:hypothetical protein